MKPALHIVFYLIIGLELLYLKFRKKRNDGIQLSHYLRHAFSNFCLILTTRPLRPFIKQFEEEIGPKMTIPFSTLTTFLGNNQFWGILASFLILDFLTYLTHFLSHKVPVLWKFHRVHHSDQTMDITTSWRNHPVNSVLNRVPFIIGVLTGISEETLLAYFLVQNFLGYLQHTQLPIPGWCDKIMRSCLLISPSIHRLHHSPDINFTDSNYGSVFNFWDRIFGVYKYVADWATTPSGLDEFRDPYWSTLEGMLLMPFFENKKMIESSESTQNADEEKSKAA